jgi:hypothetical protein
MITTKKEIKERITLCNKRFRDNTYPYQLKLWESFVKNMLVEKLQNKDYKGV